MRIRTRKTARANTPSAPAEEQELDALAGLQRVIFKYPMATQAAFSALVAEGRRFASTPEGRDLALRLTSAKEMDRARMLWEVLSMSAFTEQYDGPLPSLFVETLVRTLKTQHLEPLLTRLFERRF